MTASIARRLRATLGVLLTCIPLAVFAADPPSGGWTPSRVHPPVLMEHQNDLSKYFAEARRSALVFVQIKVNDYGKVTDARPAEGGYHDKAALEAAVNLAYKVRFRPATLNDNPVVWNGIFPVRFQIADASGSTRAVSVEFRDEARKVQSFLQDKDFAGAQFHAQWMLSEKVHNDYEYSILQTTLADSFARSGNAHRALGVIRDVTRRSSLLAPEFNPGGPLPAITLNDFALRRTPFELEHLLRLRFILAESQGMYLDALRAHADMQVLGFVKNDDATLDRFNQLLEKVKTAPELTAHIRLEGQTHWRHDLSRNRFTLVNLKGGRISGLSVICPGFTQAAPFNAGDVFTIPAEWGSCEADVTGTAGAEFDITEFQDAADSSPAASAN